MKRTLLVALLLSTLCGQLYLYANHNNAQTIQDLWNTSPIWIREYLVDASAQLPNTAHAKRKLLAHQEQVGKSFRSHYNEKVTQELVTLLKQQGQLTIDLINAIAHNKQEDIKQLERSWKQHADTLGSFLSRNNPYIDFKTIRDLLYDYHGYLIRMSTNRTKKRWIDDLHSYEDVRSHNKQIAHLIGQAIEYAFPTYKPKAQESILTLPLKNKPDEALLRSLS